MIELSDLTVKFGGVTALDHVSVTFKAPINGIIGPNGAGKTTTMNVISGFIASTGSIQYKDQRISEMKPHHRTRWGLRRSFQRELIADDLTVADNLRVMLDPLRISGKQVQEQIDWSLETVGLADKIHQSAAQLNTFERRLLDVARCLVGSPKMVMFDEPGGGLSREEANRLGDLIVQVPPLTGATALVIDHDVDLISRICVDTLVLDFGKKIAFGPTRQVLQDPKVKSAYLGIEEVA